MAEIAGKDCVIKISGSPTSMTNEATTTADDQIYQIANASKQVLDRLTPPTVKDGGSATAEAYTVNYLTGKVTFESVDNSRVITISGKYLPMTVAALAHASSNSEQADVHDVTPFGSTHKKRIAGLKSASGTLNQFDVLDTTYVDALVAGDPIVIETRPISTEEPDRFWALLESNEVSAAIDGVQDNAISWVSYDAWIRLGA